MTEISDATLSDMQILENTTLRKLATTRSNAISLIEHRRAHNICIELSGIRMPFADIKVCWPLVRICTLDFNLGPCRD